MCTVSQPEVLPYKEAQFTLVYISLHLHAVHHTVQSLYIFHVFGVSLSCSSLHALPFMHSCTLSCDNTLGIVCIVTVTSLFMCAEIVMCPLHNLCLLCIYLQARNLKSPQMNLGRPLLRD